MTDQNKIQEMQIMEQNLQNLLFQKQAFQMELAETESALKEIEKAGEDVFRIIGQLMVKADKKKVMDDLSKKKSVLDLRMKSIEKQESAFSKKIEELREDLMKSEKKK
jgi:prefoldin beta subunit